MNYNSIKSDVITKCNPVWDAYRHRECASAGWIKYITDFDKNFDRAYTNHTRLDLNSHHSLSVLELGSGAGYFAYICKQRHEIMAIDMDPQKTQGFYAAMRNALEIPSIIHIIGKPDYLPQSLHKTSYNAIVAFHATFALNWRIEEWWEFLPLLYKHLVFNGFIYLEMILPIPDLTSVVSACGGTVKNNIIRITKRV